MDYTNAFTKVDIKEEIYIKFPKEFQQIDKKDLVLKLTKSLYGLTQAPKPCFGKISERLEKHGLVKSELEKCLFMKQDIVCVNYADDTIIAGPDSTAIDNLTTILGIAKEEKRHDFELRDEGGVRFYG